MIPTPASRGINATRSERSVIGAILMGYTRAEETGLRSDDFADSLCQRVFITAKSLEAQGKIADLTTVSDADYDLGDLVELTSEAGIDRHIIDQHTESVRTASARREVRNIALNAAEMAQDMDVTLDETINLTRAALNAVGASTANDDTVSGTDAVVEFHEWLYEKPIPPIPTGLTTLDKRLGGGISGGKLVIIGARPAVGKSALLSSIALQALAQGKRVLYVSLEMEPREIISRMMASLANVSAAKMEAHELTEEENDRVVEAYSVFNGDALHISQKAVTPALVRKAALKVKAKGGLDMICIDYLQLMKSGGKVNGRTEEVGEISRALKLLAMELGVPVLAAAQVNRASTQGEDRAPRLSELRESGSIEQDADVVLLLHKPLGGELIGGACKMQLILAKNRQGSCGGHNLTFFGDHMRFCEVDNRYTEGR